MRKLLAAISVAALLTAPARAQVSQTVIVVGSTPIVGTCGSNFNLFNNSGVVGCQANGSGGSGLVVGTTTITGGSTGQILFDNAGALGEKAVTGTGSVVLATSPTLVTPTLGAATSTSETIGGATLGSNALAVTGLANFVSVGSATNPTLSVGNQTTGFYSVSTTGLGFAVNGANKFDYGISNASALTSNAVTATNFFSINSSTLLTARAAANLQLGAADAAAPVAQTLSVQSVVAGTADTGGVNRTEVGSLSTGAGVSGDIIFQTGGTGAASTVQNSKVTALTLKGATQLVNVASAGTCPTAPSLTVGNSTTGFCSVSTTGFEIAVNGVKEMDWGITTGSAWSMAVGLTVSSGNLTLAGVNAAVQAGTTGANSAFNINADTFLTRVAAANWRFGAADVAAPIAQNSERSERRGRHNQYFRSEFYIDGLHFYRFRHGWRHHL